MIPRRMEIRLLWEQLGGGGYAGSMRYKLTSALSLVLMLLAGCPSTPSNPTAPDSTGPGFADVTVRLEASVAPTVRGEFNITTADVIREGVRPEYDMHLIALVGDPESGISNITIESNLTWQCQQDCAAKSSASSRACR